MTLTGHQEQDWVNLLMASPLFKQISDLEEMLEKSGDQADVEDIVRPHVKGTGCFHEFLQHFICVSYLV